MNKQWKFDQDDISILWILIDWLYQMKNSLINFSKFNQKKKKKKFFQKIVKWHAIIY